jgi:hypothetical protein
LNRKDVPKESEVSQSEISPVQIRLSSGNPLSASQLLFKKKPNKMDFSLASVPEDKEIADEDESSSTSSDEQRSANELIESVQARNRKETALEKKARKAAVKEERKLNRQRKKLTKESFKKQQHNQHILNVQNGIANPNRVRI